MALHGTQKYLISSFPWAVSEKDYIFADKLINRAEQSIRDGLYTLTNLHFFLQNAAECYYKQRETRPDALDKTIDYCLRDIQAFPKYSKELVAEMETLPRIATFQRLAILYEKAGEIEKAIQVCDLALQYGLTDNTKSGYEGRKQKLQKKLSS